MSEAIPSLAEAMAEIRRLRARIALIEPAESEVASLPLCIRCIQLRAELHEATQLVLRLQKERFVRDVEDAFKDGTLAKPAEDEPSHVKHNLPPSAPPHDE